MLTEVFKKGDRVYHWFRGWGKVVGEVQYNKGLFEKGSVLVEFDDGRKSKLSIFSLSFTEYDLVSGGLTHERPFELEVGKSYVEKSGSAIVINRVGDYGNYGFYIGDWDDKIPCYTPGNWREATDEEVRSALEKEIIRRFGENWQDVKIVKSIGIAPYGDNDGEFHSGIFEDNEQGGWVVWNKNGRLFHKGEWADPMEESEFEPFQKVLVRDFDENEWKIDFFSHMDRKYICLTSYWSQCIPYEGNEHLLGTSKSPEK